MVAINAYQLLFSRVEAAAFKDIPQANIKRSGYQVVFHSESIAEDVPFISKRVQCFQPKDATAERFQFFTTESGYVVVSQSVKIDADPVITDQNQRPGAFIAHCYIFTRSEFSKIANDPFSLIYDDEANLNGQRIFIDNPHDMLEVARQQQHTVRLNVSRSSYKTGTMTQDYGELNKLLRLARGMNDDRTLAFMGDLGEIEATLENLITLTDRRQRTKISFDTVVDGCNPVPGAYFAVGTTRRIPNSKFVNIDIKNPKIKVDGKDPKETGYTNWLNSSLAGSDPLESVLKKAESVQQINIAFEEGNLLDNGLDQVAVNEYIAINSELILSRFKQALESEFSSQSVTLFYQDVMEQSGFFSDETIINAATYMKFQEPSLRQALAHAAYQSFIKHYPNKINQNDIVKLGDIGQEANDLRAITFSVINNLHGSGVLTSLFGGKKKIIEKRDNLISHLIQHNMLMVVIEELNPFTWSSPSYYVTKQSADQLAHWFAQQQLQEDELIAFIKSIIDAEAGNVLGHLTDATAELSQNNLKKLQKSIQKSKTPINQSFTNAIEKRL